MNHFRLLLRMASLVRTNGTNTANIFMYVIQSLYKNLPRRLGGLQNLLGPPELLLRL